MHGESRCNPRARSAWRAPRREGSGHRRRRRPAGSIKADSTRRSSQAVPHPSTNRALCRLTSEVGRDPVLSTRYGRRQMRVFEQHCVARARHLRPRCHATTHAAEFAHDAQVNPRAHPFSHAACRAEAAQLAHCAHVAHPTRVAPPIQW